MIYLNLKIPFVKDIPFLKKVSEITSISLEHETHVEETSLKGNFIISGDFKSHEVSVNKEPFSYVLPFEIDLVDDIDPDSIEFMIEDFNYEVENQNTLKVHIDFNVIGSKKEVEEPTISQEEITREVEDYFKEAEKPEEKLEDIETPTLNVEENTKESVKEELEDTRNEIVDSNEEEIQENRDLEITSAVDHEVVSEDTIINNIKSDGEEFATYHIHMVSDGESIETICTMYNSNMNILSDYNDLTNIASGDKLIIPGSNE